MKNNSQREELIKQIYKLPISVLESDIDAIADFVLADRARIAQPYIDEIKELKSEIQGLAEDAAGIDI